LRKQKTRRSPRFPPASRTFGATLGAFVLLAVFLEGTFMFGAFAFIATHLHRHYGVSLSFAGMLVMLYGAGASVRAVFGRFPFRSQAR